MQFNSHSLLEGSHAFLSASQSAWVEYDEDKLARVYAAHLAKSRGDRLHRLAYNLIKEKVRLPDNGSTLSSYVNDAIGFRMEPEQVLVGTPVAFGTADAICFRKDKLRIHDLKTGVTEASMRQLHIYAAFFCLEYLVKPFDIEMELRIYQNDEIKVDFPDPDLIFHYMDRAITGTTVVTEVRKEVLG